MINMVDFTVYMINKVLFMSIKLFFKLILIFLIIFRMEYQISVINIIRSNKIFLFLIDILELMIRIKSYKNKQLLI
jgi:hypothetical protein